MMIKFLDLHRQYLSIKDEVDVAIASVIRDNAFIGGEYVRRFEESFAGYQQVESCVGVGNGTDALEIAIEALDLAAGSEIIVPANSFIASAEAVSRTGHEVVFCDINLDDYTLDVSDVRQKVTERTSAVMAVHLYGHPCDMDPLLKLARQNNLKVIEDCAQAHGAEYKGRRVGGIGDIGAFSFYPGKNLGAYGDAGAIVTCDENLATKCRMIANHGRIAKYDHKFAGRNSRLDGLQAAILNVKLQHLDKWTAYREQIAATYEQRLSHLGTLTLPRRSPEVRHAYHLFVVRHPDRVKLKSHLMQRGIQCVIHYPTALPDLPAYTAQRNASADAARVAAASVLSLPMGEHLTCDEPGKVVSACCELLE